MRRKLDTEQKHQIDEYLESLYENSIKIGEKFVTVGFDNKTQVRGFENMVASVTRFSDVVNYIKNQAGKDNKNKWTRVAPDMLDQLGEMEIKAQKLGKDDPGRTLKIKMKLARGWTRQIVTHYLFQLQQTQKGR